MDVSNTESVVTLAAFVVLTLPYACASLRSNDCSTKPQKRMPLWWTRSTIRVVASKKLHCMLLLARAMQTLLFGYLITVLTQPSSTPSASQLMQQPRFKSPHPSTCARKGTHREGWMERARGGGGGGETATRQNYTQHNEMQQTETNK